jgi:hypothetical protein
MNRCLIVLGILNQKIQNSAENNDLIRAESGFSKREMRYTLLGAPFNTNIFPRKEE